MRIMTALVLLFGSLGAMGTPHEEKLKLEHQKLQGSWKLISLEADGDAVPDADLPNLVLSIKDEKFDVKINDDQSPPSKFQLDLNGSLKLIDFFATERDDQVKTYEGIYTLDGDKWTVCVSSATTVKIRPTEFKTKANSETILLVFAREKS